MRSFAYGLASYLALNSMYVFLVALQWLRLSHFSIDGYKPCSELYGQRAQSPPIFMSATPQSLVLHSELTELSGP